MSDNTPVCADNTKPIALAVITFPDDLFICTYRYTNADNPKSMWRSLAVLLRFDPAIAQRPNFKEIMMGAANAIYAGIPVKYFTGDPSVKLTDNDDIHVVREDMDFITLLDAEDGEMMEAAQWMDMHGKPLPRTIHAHKRGQDA
jgi:hypothetical protein